MTEKNEDIHRWAVAVWERYRLMSSYDDQIAEIEKALLTERDRCLRAANVQLVDKSAETPDSLRACIVDAIETGLDAPYA